MLMNLGIFACGCRHQNSPNTRFLCWKLLTLYPIPECTYAQRSNALPKILPLETDYIQSKASCAIAIKPRCHHNSNWSCSAHPPVITLCRFDINFDCCVCSHSHLLAAACITSVPYARLVGKIGGNIWSIFRMAGLPKYCSTRYQPNIDLNPLGGIDFSGGFRQYLVNIPRQYLRRYLGTSTKKERLDRDPPNLNTILSSAKHILGVRKSGGTATLMAARCRQRQQ